MKNLKLFPVLLILFLTTSLFSQPSTIKWDRWGVPHIYANNVEELFYAQGWAQMHNHANLILELYGGSRGRGAEYWGKENLLNDQLVHTLGFEALSREWEAQQSAEVKTMFNAFIQGMNDYAKAYPESIDKKNRVVLPLTTQDLNMHSMYVVFTRFVAGGDLERTQEWPDLGSNAYAVGPSRSASGNAMLVQNPHLPWWREFMFTEAHFILNGRNMYGANLVGFPGIAIGFNDVLGWSHTNNVIDNTDTYELELQDGGYLLDGERKEFQVSSKTVKVMQEDGSLVEQTIPIMKTQHGPVVNRSDDKVLAIRMTGMDRPQMFLQWWRMLNSQNHEEFEAALQMAQIPFWNVMYADKFGDIFYLFNGLVPERSQGDWEYWDRIIPGGKAEDIWSSVHPYSDLPKVKNPANGWLQNANDPPWTSTIPPSLDPEDYPAYMSPKGMSFRPQRSARMLMEDTSISFDELVDYKLSTRMEAADRILDDLDAAVKASESALAKEAMEVLNRWDREADADSKGTLLFFNWARKFGIWNRSNYAQGWSWENPHTTPDGIADPERAVNLLEAAAEELKAGAGTLEVPWGNYYRIKYNGKDLPANGADGWLGVFRVAWPGGSDGKQMFVGGGDSWVGVIEFGNSPKAKVLLSYGNATQDGSPHKGDQLELFSKKQLRDAWLTEDEINSNTIKIEVRGADKFYTQQ